jgi:hypothetical protein
MSIQLRATTISHTDLLRTARNFVLSPDLDKWSTWFDSTGPAAATIATNQPRDNVCQGRLFRLTPQLSGFVISFTSRERRTFRENERLPFQAATWLLGRRPGIIDADLEPWAWLGYGSTKLNIACTCKHKGWAATT